MDITDMTMLELSGEIKAGRISSMEAVQAYLDKIEEQDGIYHCYISVWKKEALECAERVQRRIEAGELADSPVAGVPAALKDNICTKGKRTTCASRMLEHFVPPYNAEAAERLEAAGAVILGKTNLDEFAMGSTTETSAFFRTRNPWNTEHVPGGSSGGSAAAVAAGEAVFALGSDTGGSIRQPSSFCGVTGVKPTYGTVSRYGLIAYASSLDQIGPVARNVSDCAAVLEVISGRDTKDSTSATAASYRYSRTLQEGVEGLRIGIPRGYFGCGLQPEVGDSVLGAAKVLQSAGASVEEFDLEAVEYAVPAYYVIASAEAGSNLSRYDGVKYGYRAEGAEGLQELYRKSRSEGFGPEAQRRMLIGAFVLSSGYYDAYYKKALQVKTLIRRGFDRAFEQYDLLLGPVAPATAPKFGESLPDPVKMYLGDIYTVAVNLAGLPAVSVPCGIDQSGLPVGLQLIGKPFGEGTMLRAAYTYELSRPYAAPPAFRKEMQR